MVKIAFVHDRIITKGGAEKVFFDIIENTDFSEAKIFTLFSKQKEIKLNKKKLSIISVISNKFILEKIGYRNLFVFFPILTKILNFKINRYKADKLIISSFAIAKNIDSKGYKKLYLHSPMQYIWDSYEEYINKFKGFKKLIFKFSAKILKKWDLKYTKFDLINFNSKYTQTLAKDIYNMEGNVIYPKISEEILNTENADNPDSYYVYIGRLVKFSKEVDKIIELFNQTEENLLIIGDGPDYEYLRSLVKGNIIFLGYIDDEKEKAKILRKAKGLINITKESFGISTSEALTLGVPVFGYNLGATKEMINESNGILVEKKDLNTLREQFEKFQNMNFDRKKIRENFLGNIR